jgi:hypothetical protein
MSVLTRLRDRVGGSRVRLGRELRAVYLDERRVARQLRGHGAQVPYAGLAENLGRLADQADHHAARLAQELRVVGGNADPFDTTTPRTGRNHWERLTIDLADLESLQRRYADLAREWDVEFPETAATLAELAAATATMSKDVRAMVARSDPHADN